MLCVDIILIPHLFIVLISDFPVDISPLHAEKTHLFWC